MKRSLHLEYDIPTGRLTPYFEALAEGRAMARRCVDCEHVAFPPALTCAACGSIEGDWTELSGYATILHRTDTPDAAFALARLDGASNAVIAGLINPQLTASHAQLVPPVSGVGVWLELKELKS